MDDSTGQKSSIGAIHGDKNEIRACGRYPRKVVDDMKSVIKGTSYILAHTPDMVLHNGTTQTTERIVNPESDYL